MSEGGSLQPRWPPGFILPAPARKKIKVIGRNINISSQQFFILYLLLLFVLQKHAGSNTYLPERKEKIGYLLH